MSRETAQAGSSGLPSIEKLDGNTNYSTWKFMMELYLIHDDLWGYTSVSPPETDLEGTKRDQRARAKICLMVRPHCLVHVRKAKTAKEAWEALRTAFEDKGLNNRCRLLSKLVSLKLEQFSSVREYVTTVMATSQELLDLGKEIDDELLAALLLQGLTLEFQSMRLAIENSNIDITTDYVKTKLFQMEETFSRGSNTSHPTSALITNKKGKSAPQNMIKGKIKCFICNGPHKAKECPDNPKKRKEAMQAGAFGTSVKPRGDDWIIDSGASTHMSNRLSWFKNLRDSPNPLIVTCADGSKVSGEREGMVVCESGLTVNKVTYVPKLVSNLLSVHEIAKKGHVIVFTERGCDIFKSDECEVKGKACVKGVEECGIYKIKCCSQGSALTSATGGDQLMLWHRRMGHLGIKNLKLLRDKMATGVSFPNDLSQLECIPCVMGKQTKQPFSKSNATRAKEALGLVHADVCGPMEELSAGKCRYFLTFIDDFSRKTFIYFLKQKSEVFEKFIEFQKLAENVSGKKLKILRTDNGTEFVNKQLDGYLKKCGIQHQLTVEYTPEQNGVAERANRTICEKARSMLQDSGLSKRFWAEAVHHAVFLKNRSPTLAVKDMTPEEKWSGRKCDLSMVKTFGCKAFMHIPQQKRRKWDPKSRELVYTGFCDDAKAYRLLDPTNANIFKARNVVFFENQKHLESSKSDENTEEILELTEHSIERHSQANTENHSQENHPLIEGNDVRNVEGSNESLQSPENTDVTEVHQGLEYGEAEDVSREERDRPRDDREEPYEADEFEDCESDAHTTADEEEQPDSGRRYPLRNRKPKQFPDFVLYQAAKQDLELDPVTVQEALSRHDSSKWKEAIQEELSAFEKNKIWRLVKPQPGANIVDSKWIFKIKNEAGNKRRYKARLVARGFSQRRGIDYHETFSPVVRHESLRTLLALAVETDMNVDHMDVKTAFLNGELEERVFMKQPEGFEVKGKEDYVCLLQKSLYGLKQASRAWNTKLDTELKNLGFQQLESEPCIYKRRRDNNDRNLIIIAIYVDDLLIFWRNEDEMRAMKKQLMSKFDMKDLGKAELILGVRVTQKDGYIKLDQESFIEKMLKKFNMSDCKPATTPLVVGQQLERGTEEMQSLPYRELIGSLMYAAVCTRPDIAFAVSYLSQFNNCYNEEHWRSAKNVLRYLKGTKNTGLVYTKTGNFLEAFADASHGGDITDRKSYTGYVFTLAGSAVSWESRKQQVVALSSAEAEYVSLSEATREAIFLRRLIKEVSGISSTLVMRTDSQSAMAIASHHTTHKRTKHIDVRHHYVRNAVQDKIIKLSYLDTKSMPADCLTKALAKTKFSVCVTGMGVKV